jgi:RNA-splicing ligase RtcB
MSRGEANRNVDLEEFRESMTGIYTTSVCDGTRDEAPMVYKSMDSIIEQIKDTVDIIDIIKPIYNYKAH